MAPLIISISGIRGVIGKSLGCREATEFAMAFGTFLQEKGPAASKSSDGLPRVCIGRDSRGSGAMLLAAVSAGLMATGCETVDLGVATTPGVALMTRYLHCAGGVVITASHNPSEWNGIKFLRADGTAFAAAEAERIHALYNEKQFCPRDAQSVGTSTTSSKAHAVHVDTVMQLCDKMLIASRRFRVVLDSINGAGCVVTAQLLSALGCEVIHVNNRPTGVFAHGPEPTAQNLSDLGVVVKKHAAQIGFAQDPDGDRLALIDEEGTYIGEEYTLALAAKYIFSKKQGTAATNLSTSRMIDDLAATVGCSVIRTPVGEAHVANTMLANNCIVGGEGNGGVIDLRVVPVRDSLVAIVLILQLLAETGKTVSQLVKEIPRYHMIKAKLTCPPDKTASVLTAVKSHFADGAQGKNAKIDHRDGIRIDLAEGWVHVRASNTEPIVRIVAESNSPQQAQELIDQVQRLGQLCGRQ